MKDHTANNPSLNGVDLIMAEVNTGKAVDLFKNMKQVLVAVADVFLA